MTQPALDAPAIKPRRSWGIYAARFGGWILIAAVVWGAAVAGLRIRYYTYQVCDPLRFIGDMYHGLFWGLETTGPEGYFNQYDKMAPEVPEWKDSNWAPWLDYNPLRLGVMREWGAWVRSHQHLDPDLPLTEAWQRPYWFTEPMLHFNTALEGLAAVAGFLLTRHWVIRGSAGEKHGHFHGIWQGLLAALFLWFSPDIILNAHAWPQWDTWLVPFYLLGCLLASLDWWFAAGVVILIGANLKGQMLSVAPIFIIWPLVQGRIGAAVRWICGAVFCYALIVSGWLITYIAPNQLAAARAQQVGVAVSDYPPTLFAMHRIFDLPAVIWIFEILLVSAAVPWILRTLAPPPLSSPAPRWKMILHSRWTWIAAGALLIVVSVLWPWLLPRNRSAWYIGLVAGVAVAAGSLLLRFRARLYMLAAIAGGALFACIWLFHGGTGWWDCGMRYGSIHWPYLFTGPTSNIPAVFNLRFGWPRDVDEIAFSIPIHGTTYDITQKAMFTTISVFFLVLSGIGIGLQTRRNDRRALVAFVTPWIVVFLFSVQMQERYLLWAGAAAACCIGESVGMALLGFALTLFSAAMPLKILLDKSDPDLDQFGQNLSTLLPRIFSPDLGHVLRRYIDPLQPDIAWGILVIALVFLYISLTPSSKRTI